ncbi:Uncharacterized mitochondrial protein AtMg00310 [Linum perenne]
MGCFLLPNKIIHRFHLKKSRFWWGQCGDTRRMHWVSWEKLCHPKEEGGLVFRNLKAFNQEMLALNVSEFFNNQIFSRRKCDMRNILLNLPSSEKIFLSTFMGMEKNPSR